MVIDHVECVASTAVGPVDLHNGGCAVACLLKVVRDTRRSMRVIATTGIRMGGTTPADLVLVGVVLGLPGEHVAVLVGVERARCGDLGVAVPRLQEGAGAVGAVVAAPRHGVTAVVLKLAPGVEGVGETLRGTVGVPRVRILQPLLISGVRCAEAAVLLIEIGPDGMQ